MKYFSGISDDHYTADVYVPITLDAGQGVTEYRFLQNITCTIEGAEAGNRLNLYYKDPLLAGWQVRNIKDRRGTVVEALGVGVNATYATVAFYVAMLSAYGYSEGYKMAVQ